MPWRFSERSLTQFRAPGCAATEFSVARDFTRRVAAGNAGLSGRNELVAEAWDGDDSFRVRGIKLDLSAQAGDVRITRSLVTDIVALPETLHDLATREDPSRVLGKQRQQVVFRRGERDWACRRQPPRASRRQG